MSGHGTDALDRLVDPATRPEPYPVLATLRAASPYVASAGVVVVGRHADCSSVLRDPRMSSDRDRAALAPAGDGPRTRNFLHLDPPDHTRFRRLVVQAFSARVVSRLEPRIRAIAAELFDAAAARGRLEVVADLAYPLPLRVICELLGVPFEDRDLLLDWSGKLSEALEPPLPGLVSGRVTVEAARARAAFVGYFRRLIADRRAHPRDDLITRLVRAEEHGHTLSESELLATCVLLVNAGHETTVNLVSNGILALLRHPDQFAMLCQDPTLATSAVDEVLRYDAPVQLTTRVARGAGRIGAAEVRAGDTVLLLLAAANRDPEVYNRPDRFDIRRRQDVTHLAFAAGPHFCIGAGLAALEARIVLETFARRVADPGLRGEPVTYKPNLCLRGPDRLDVDFAEIRPAAPI